MAGELVRVFEDHIGEDSSVPDPNPLHAVECDMPYARVGVGPDGRPILLGLGCAFMLAGLTLAEAIEWADAHAAHGCADRVRHDDHVDDCIECVYRNSDHYIRCWICSVTLSEPIEAHPSKLFRHLATEHDISLRVKQGLWEMQM